MSTEPRLPMPPWSMVLGFGSRAQGELDYTRRLQIEELARSRPVGLSLNLLVAGVVAGILSAAVPPGPLLGWLGLMIGMVALGFWQLRRDPKQPSTPRRLLARTTLNASMLGLLWAVPPAFLSRWAGVREVAVLALLVPGIMAGAAFLLPAAPVAAVAFLAMVGLGGVALMAGIGAPDLAVAALLCTALMTFACLRQARALMQRRGIELVLAEKESVISLLLREFGEGADWLWRTDAAKALTDVGPRAAHRFGRPTEALEGRPLLELLAGDHWQDGKVADGLRDLAEKLKLQESFADIELPVTIAGQVRWWSLSAVPRHDEAGRFTGFQGMASDVTERRRSAEKIDRMARFDALTGLANRRQAMNSLAAAVMLALRDRREAALLIIDLDRFKQVNDSLGHPVGDALLKQVAERLRALCGSEAEAGRLGGDEFAVVVGNAEAEEVDRLASRIVVRLSEPYDVDGHRLYIGASIGSAMAPRDGRASETLVRNADLALYRAKDDGRGVHRRYEQRLSARAEERRRIETALRDALEKGEFRLVYQPIVRAANAQVEGFEAYLRWTHPDLGEVTPDRFLPIAEEARLIARIGEWVIRTGCQEAASWPGSTRLTLNLSAGQLDDPQLAAIIVSALATSGLPAERLELEVSETVYLRPGSHTHAVLDRLHATGVRVAISDVGMGYASLGYLRGARFSTIKLDRSFVVGASRNAADSLAVIRAVVAIADSMGMTVIAEGTETEREYEMVRRLGCEQAQGYYFGHPMPPAEARAIAAGTLDRQVA